MRFPSDLASPPAWAILPAAVFIFILPFSHTVGLRLTSLFFAGLATIIWFARAARPRLPLKLSLLLWGLVALMSLLWSANPRYSLEEIKNEYVYAVIAFAIFYFTACRADRFRWIVSAAWVGFITTLFIALIQFARHGHWHPHGLIGGMGTFSTYLITLLPFLLFTLRTTPITWSIAATAVVTVTALVGYMTMNRAFWPTLVVASIVAAVLAVRLRHAAFRWLSVAVAIMTVVVAAGMLQTVFQHRIGSPHGHSLVDQLEKDERLPIWRHAATQIQNSPWHGAGFGRGIKHHEYVERFHSPLKWHAHNLFLNYGVQMGIWGPLVLLVVFGSIAFQFWLLYRSADDVTPWLGAAGLVMLAAVLTKNMTDDFFVRENALLFWALTGTLLGYGRSRLMEARDNEGGQAAHPDHPTR